MVNRSLPVGFGSVVSTSLRRVVGSRTLQLFLIGGLIFVFFFYWRYGNIPDELYQTRDDGVITMSHARNLVDYGFIGVNPSGGRVEGFSAPVQFWVYAGAYALTGVGYDAFAAWQTALGAFLLGALFILFFRESRWRAVIITALAGLLLSWHYSFLGWHGSGMENAITHVLFLAAALILFSFARNGRIVYPWAIVVFLASISRIDSIYYIGPVLAIFSAWWMLAFRGLKPRMAGCCFSLAVVGLWLAYNLWRYVYFGDLTPNVAYAQGIEAVGGLERWQELGWDAVTLYAEFYRDIFVRHGVYILLVALPLLYFARRSRAGMLMLAVIGCIVVAGCLAPFFFGEALHDVSRTTTHLAVFVTLGLGLIIDQLKNRRIKNRKLLLGTASVLGVVGVAAFNIYGVDSYYMCCWSGSFESQRQQFDGFADREGLPRPTVFNGDLGVISWHKHFNVIDLGRLGSPIVAKLQHSEMFHPFADYFFDYAAPDFIESHLSSFWTCHNYRNILAHPKLDTRYRAVNSTEFTLDNCDPPYEYLQEVWMRADILRASESRERKLIDTLSGNLSIDALRRELAGCQSVPANNCAYVARTAYRFLPEFRNAGLVDQLNDVFSSSRTKDYDLYLINGYRDGQAHQRAIEFIVNNWIAGVRQDEPIIRSAYEVFIHNGALIYLKSGCRERDTDARFFLHLFPADQRDLPEGRSQYGFNNFGFDFEDNGLRIGGHCFAAHQLPEYANRRIRTGQYDAEGQLWNGEFHAIP